MPFAQVQASIINNPELQVLNVSELAFYFGYSKGYFCRRFKREFGISPSRFLARLKIKKAKKKVKKKPAISGYNLAQHIGLKDEKMVS